MTAREEKHVVELQEWISMVSLCQECGLTVNQWRRENDMKPV